MNFSLYCMLTVVSARRSIAEYGSKDKATNCKKKAKGWKESQQSDDLFGVKDIY